MPTITTRLTFAYTAFVAVIVAVLVGTVYTRLANGMSRNLDDEMRTYTDFLLSEVDVSRHRLRQDYDRMRVATEQVLPRFPALRLVLIAGDSVVYSASRRLRIPDLLDTLRSGSRLVPTGFQTLEFQGVPLRTYSRLVPVDTNGQLGSLLVIASLEEYAESVSAMEELLIYSALFALLAAGGGGWLISRRALAPVASMTAAAAEISSSKLDRRVPVGASQDELSMLARTFNDMIERLQQSFESQRRFIADASHDIRTPISVVRGELELLQGRIEGEPATRDALERAISELDRLSRLANDLLLLARADAGQLPQAREQVRLDELLAESASALRVFAMRKDVSIKVDIYDAAEVRCDVAMLRRALSNLVENAIKFSPPQASVRASLFVTGRRASIVIIDRGEGIPSRDLPRIFDRFYRGDRSRVDRGTGLGLTIARAIIEDHNGTVHIASETGAGTTITVTLPVVMDSVWVGEPAD